MEERTYREEAPSDNTAGEDTNPAKGTPPIGDQDVRPGQTQTPASGDDVGVPADEELNRES